MSTDERTPPKPALGPKEQERADHIAARECPAWKHRIERGCLVMKGADDESKRIRHEVTAEYLCQPSPETCDRCWQRAQQRGMTECRTRKIPAR